MARIDGLLRLVIQQGADELRLVVEREPKMYARGVPKRLSVPATSEETLRILLGDILSPEREEELKANGRAQTVYEAAGIGAFKVKLKLAAAGGFEVVFLSGEVHGLDLTGALPVPAEPASSSHKTTIGHASTVPQPPSAEPIHPVQSVARSTLLGASAHVEGATPVRAPVPNKPSGTLPDAGARASRHPPPPSAAFDSDASAAHDARTRPGQQPPPSAALDHGTTAAHDARTRPGQQPPPSAALERDTTAAHDAGVRAREQASPSRALGTTTARDQPAFAAAAEAYDPHALPEAHGARVSHGSNELNELLRRALGLGASDLHLAEGEAPRVRVDGKLTELSQSRIGELLPLLDLDDASSKHLLRTGAADLALELPKLGRMRVHVYRTDAGYAAALRLLPRAAPSFSDLNMPIAFDDLVDQPHGLVLVCGAAGAGKSTTLAALAQEVLRRRSVLMVTLEDPIEYTLTPTAHSIVRRRQVGRDVRDFPSGLRDALRADPEVLLVGEMRDPTSITLALTAAETGHLVLSSLHSGSATSAIERIVDAYPTAHKEQIRTQLSDALRAIIVQRLLPRAHNTGRIPAVEVLRVTRAVASLIREGKTAQLPTVLQSSRREGMISLERSLADRVQAGEVLLPAASAAANDPDALLTYLGAGKSRAV